MANRQDHQAQACDLLLRGLELEERERLVAELKRRGVNILASRQSSCKSAFTQTSSPWRNLVEVA